MRLSTEPSDAVGYAAWRDALGSDIRIFLDDIEQHQCSSADDEEGFVIRCCKDDNGNLVQEDGYLKLERVKGNVRIEIAPKA